MADLHTASREWASRPDDERFETLEDMLEATRAYAAATTEVNYRYNQLEAQVHPEFGLVVVGPSGKPATFTNYSFGQFCNRVGAPAGYLRELPSELAAANLRHGLKEAYRENQKPQNLLVHSNGHATIRTVLSHQYERIWNHDLVSLCMQLPSGWRVPPARPAHPNQKGTRIATEADCLRMRESGLSIKPGATIAPAGLYASDHDMFAFMVNEDYCLDASGKERMARGFFLRNSEVGDCKLSLTMFYYSYVCGNHIVWGAEDVKTFDIVHKGRKAQNFEGPLRNAVHQLTGRGLTQDRQRVIDAKAYVLGTNDDDVVQTVFAKRKLTSKEAAKDALRLAHEYSDVHGNPRSAWGFAAGLTRLSQGTGFTDKRADLDTAARKVIELAW